MDLLEVRWLGKFEIKYKGKPIPIPSRPAQSLFAYLILNAGAAHRRERHVSPHRLVNGAGFYLD
jgi:DNA-binding SARP family transcriptional activator